MACNAYGTVGRRCLVALQCGIVAALSSLRVCFHVPAYSCSCAAGGGNGAELC